MNWLKRLLRFLLFAQLISGAAACHAPTSTSPEEVECYVRYLKPEGQALAQMVVRRREREEMRSAEVPGGVRYREALMQMVVLEGTITYRSETSGAFAAQHTFAWSDAEGQPRTFTLQMSPASDLSFGSPTLPLSRPATLRWHGPPIAENESWVVLWEKADRSATVPMEIISAAGMDFIEFPAAQLAKLGPGTWTYYVVRRKAFRQEVPGYLLKGVAEYYSDPDTVQLVP